VKCGQSKLMALMILALSVAGHFRVEAADGPARVLVSIEVRSNTDIEQIRDSGYLVCARLPGPDGTVLLAGVESSDLGVLEAAGLETRVLDPDIRGKQYYITYVMPGRDRPVWSDYGELLYEDEGYAVLSMRPEGAVRLAEVGVELRAVIMDPKPLPDLAVRGSAPVAITPDPVIQEMIDLVDSATVYQYTGDLSGEWAVDIGGSPYTIVTRYTYSGTPISKATQYAGEHLAGLGLDVEYHQWEGSTYPNVIGELQGKTSPDSIFIICGHIDDMPSGPVAPGADDNASGCVAVLAAADILTQYEWPYTLRFALWTGEEQGLWGSYAYAQRSYGWGEDIIAVLNLDMIAYNTSGSSRDIDLHADDDMPGTMELAQLFSDVVDAYNIDLIPQIIPNGTGASDHASFWDYGYVAILGIEDFADFNPRYHTTGDQLQHLDMGYYFDFVKACVGTFAHMSGGPLPSTGVAWRDDEGALGIRTGAALYPAYPNPAHPATVIRYDINKASGVSLRIHDARGALVKTLFEGTRSPGTYEVVWNGLNESGEACSPGLYFYNLKTTDGANTTQKLVLVE
jgi:hypothetical protein